MRTIAAGTVGALTIFAYVAFAYELQREPNETSKAASDETVVKQAVAGPPAAEDLIGPADLIRQAVAQLIAMQEDGGQWPYEGVYRVRGELPIGYRVGGTAIVGGVLLAAAPGEADALGESRGIGAAIHGVVDINQATAAG